MSVEVAEDTKPTPTSLPKKQSVPKKQPDETKKLETLLRPESFETFVGQKQVKQILSVVVKAAKLRKDALDHILFAGPAGLGKTTLSFILAHEMGTKIHWLHGPTIKDVNDLAFVLMNAKRGDIVYLDEIHRLSPRIQEMLYPAMEDYTITWVDQKSEELEPKKLRLAKFTLIASTTRTSLLSAPLRDRFGHKLDLGLYSPKDLVAIVTRSAKILKVKLDPSGAKAIADRCRRTPRTANHLLSWARDYALVHRRQRINQEVVLKACEMSGINPYGLDPIDQRLLEVIIDIYNGGPVGLKSLAASMNQDEDNIEGVIEPYLIQGGYMVRTPKGREVTDLAYKALGRTEVKPLH